MNAISLALQILTVVLLIGSFVVMTRLKSSYDRKFAILQDALSHLQELLVIFQRKGLTKDPEIHERVAEINSKVRQVEETKRESVLSRILRPIPPKPTSSNGSHGLGPRPQVYRNSSEGTEQLTAFEKAKFPIFCPSCEHLMTACDIAFEYDDNSPASRTVHVTCLKCRVVTSFRGSSASDHQKPKK